MLDVTQRFNKEKLREFAFIVQEMSEKIGFKVSSRGWCYLMESARYINKDQFDKVESLINKCRKEGFLPVDFVAEEDARAFSGVEEPDEYPVARILKWRLQNVLEDPNGIYTADWWEGEEYYIQMLVEKIDLKTLFEPVCHKYHIPVANSKGWSSILQRAEYARRFKEAEDKGLQCVLLYCGDHDPDGLRISDAIRENLIQIANIEWEDGTQGYWPTNLTIERFGLNYNFIQKHKYTWIDNLISGSGKDLASPRHPNYKLPYMQDYLSTIGERKCEANAVVTTPDAARLLCRETIERYLGRDALGRFAAKEAAVREEYEQLLERYDPTDKIDEVVSDVQDDEDNE